MTALHVLVALLMLQEPAPVPEPDTGRRTAIFLRTLVPAGTSGSVSHQEDAVPNASLDAGLNHVDPFFDLSLVFDLGPFTGPTHMTLMVEYLRTGFEAEAEANVPTHPGNGQWQSIEATLGADWMREGRLRVGGGVSFGFHIVDYNLLTPQKVEIDDSITVLSIGFHFYVEQPLGSHFRLGAETRAAILTSGGSGFGSESDFSGEDGRGRAFFLTGWIAWEPLHRFSLRVGYAVWKGMVEWDVTPLLSTSTATSKVDVTAHGPLLGLEVGF